MNRKISSALYSIAEKTILFLSGLIIVWLFLTAEFSTSVITNEEIVYYLKDSFFCSLCPSVFFSLLVFILNRRCLHVHHFFSYLRQDTRYSQRIRRVILSVIFFIGTVFVLLCQHTPASDSNACITAAQEILDHNYAALYKGGYAYAYPNQLGLIWLLTIIESIAGRSNYIVMQLINVTALTFFYWTLAKITDLYARDILPGTIALGVCAIFLPGYFYTTFIYGTLIGLSFATGGFYCCILFNREKRWWQAVLMVLFLSCSIICKSNYLIFVVGILIFQIVTITINHSKRLMVTIILTAFVLIGTDRFINTVTYAITGVHSAEGMSKWAWVAMGLQDSGSGYNPGWFNRYNEKTFPESGFNTDIQSSAAKASIKKSLEHFASDPEYAIEFFSKKNASQWNNPDFEGVFINQEMHDAGEPSNFIGRLFSMKGSSIISRLTDILFKFMVIGLLMELVLGRKERRRYTVFLAFKVILIGGFLFHTVWEAKAQYTLPYMMLMIPVSVWGWEMLFMRLSRGTVGGVLNSCSSGRREGEAAEAEVYGSVDTDDKKNFSEKSESTSKAEKIYSPAVRRMHLSAWGKSWIIGLAAVILLVQSGVFPPLNALFLRDTDDTADFNTYVQLVTPLHLPEGEYALLAPTSQGDMEIAADNNPVDGTEQLYIRPVSQDAAGEDNHITLVHSAMWDRQYLRLHADDLLLEVPEGHTDDGQIVQSGEQRHSASQQWQIYPCADGTCRIMLAGSQQALTFHEDGQYLELSRWEDAPEQHWTLQAVTH